MWYHDDKKGHYVILLFAYSIILIPLTITAILLSAAFKILMPTIETGYSMIELIGKLHPLFVHFPVALITISSIFRILEFFIKNNFLKAMSFYILLIAGFFLLPTLLTGWINSFDYPKDSTIVDNHRFFAIILTILTWLTLITTNMENKSYKVVYAIGLMILIAITGHLGAILTHGHLF